MDEVLLDERHVRVTVTEVQVSGRTYPLASVASAHVVRRTPSPRPPLLLAVGAGLVLLFTAPCGLMALDDPSNSAAAVVGLTGVFTGATLLGMAGLAYLLRGAPKYAVMLDTIAGERQALLVRDYDFAVRVCRAVTNAITKRG